MDAQEIIQELVNMLWRTSPLDESGDKYTAADFRTLLHVHYPDLDFTYSPQTKEWLLLTDIFTI